MKKQEIEIVKITENKDGSATLSTTITEKGKQVILDFYGKKVWNDKLLERFIIDAVKHNREGDNGQKKQK